MNRRAALAAAFAAAAVRSSAANSAVSVGAGLLAKHTPARVAALCDVNPAAMESTRKAVGGDPRLYSDLHQLLASDLDAVVIATPVFLHAEHFEAAAKSGKHIYIEKPAAVDVADCKRILRAADSIDRKINVSFGFQRRYAELYKKGKQIADSGVVGPIHMGSARFIKSAGAPRAEQSAPPPKATAEQIKQWVRWKHLSGDLIVENNVHSIDVLNWFLGGHPLSAIGSGGTTVPRQGDTRDHNFVAFEYAAGVQGQLSGATLASPGYRDVVEQFFGEKGFLETSENHLRQFFGPGKETVEKTPRNNSIDSVAAFVQRIAEGKPENTAQSGVHSSLTAILGRMAMDKRREVTWDEMMRS
jgi:myo-inositol 2-dehydrogenase / D-chiro-inositol 1-dehydrogenase